MINLKVEYIYKPKKVDTPFLFRPQPAENKFFPKDAIHTTLVKSTYSIVEAILVCWNLTKHCFAQFQSTYGKPLIAAKDSKCSAKDAEAGILAMEALHKQVFILCLIF